MSSQIYVQDWGGHPNCVRRIDTSNPPTFLRAFLIDAEPLEFLSRIVDIPSIDLALWLLWLVGKSIELFYPAQLASPGPNAIVDLPGLPFIVETKAYESEIAALKSQGRRNARRWSRRPQCAFMYDLVRYPELTRFRVWVFGCCGRSMTEDKVVRCKVKCSFDLLAPTNELNFFDLCCISP